MTQFSRGDAAAPFRGEVDIVDSRVSHDGYFQLVTYRFRHSLFAGGWSPVMQREVFERGHAAAVVLYDPEQDVVVMIEQFRIGAERAGMNPWLLEVVAGIVEPGEEPDAVVRREAEEEADCRIGRMERIGCFLTSQGGSSETVTLYCGQVDSRGVGGLHGLPAEGEDIRASVMSWPAVTALLDSGEISNLTCLAGLQWLALNRSRLRQAWT